MIQKSKSVVSHFTTFSTSVRDAVPRDEYHIMEIEKEVTAIESICKSMCADLEHSPLTAKYVAEIQRMWALLNKTHNNGKKLADIIKDQIQAIANSNVKLTVASETSKGEQKTIDKLTQEVQRALRMVDTAHTREQVAQETIENLRQQINRLHSEVEAKSRHSDQDGDFSSMAKTKEAQAKERERMVNEITSLRERLNVAMSYQEELERKNSSADLRISELQQELENQVNEMSKESRFKERFEDDLQRVRKEVAVKENQIASLNEQIADFQFKIQQLQNNNKDLRALNDKLNQTIELLNQRLFKSQDEYQREVAVVEEMRQTITVLNNQLKMNSEEIAKLLSEIAKTSTIQENYKKKLNKIENQKNALEVQKAKLTMDFQTLQRSVKEETKKGKEDKILFENTVRERDIMNKNLQRANGLVNEKERVIKLSEQAKLYLEHEIDGNRQEITRQSQHITALEKEKDRYVADAVILTKRLEASIEDTKLQQVQLSDFKKKLTETEAKLNMKVAESENIRYELNTCSKNLNEAQEDIIEFKHKVKVMTLQIEQLKEDIAGKEMQLMREQLALRKAHAEKEAMRVETSKVEDELKETRRVVSNLEVELNSQSHIIREADMQRDRDRKQIEQLTNARDVINSQLVRRNDELALLKEKVKTMQSTLDASESHYNERMEDIRLLRLEIQTLSSDKEVMIRTLNNTADLRTEIHHLEKDLGKERLRARALEEELQNPLNIHRWRKLEGSDPAKYELIQKVKVQQKRILDQAESIVVLEEKCAELQRRHDHLEQMLSRYQHQQSERERAESCKQRLQQSETKIKYLLGDLQMRMEQVNELKCELEKLTNETITWKEKFYEQKKLVEKLKEKPKDKKNNSNLKTAKSSNTLGELPPLPNKSRFMGGGFNISNSSI